MKVCEILSEGYKQYDKQAQQVWAAKTVAKKKEILTKMVDTFKYKAKQQQFYGKIERENRGTVLDKFAADIMQTGHGDSVVR